MNMMAGLHMFNLSNEGRPDLSRCSFSCYASKQLWHNRLGHPADQVLNVLQQDLNFNNKSIISPCEVCHKAKQTREPFPLSDHKTERLGDLIHLDLWGPYRVQSKEGYKFFLTIVDDYTRAVWVYLLKSKDETCDNIQQFYNLLHTQFDVRVKKI